MIAECLCVEEIKREIQIQPQDLKFIRVNGEYRFGLAQIVNHKEMLNPGEIPESAGIITLSETTLKIEQGYSLSLLLALQPDDIPNLCVMFGVQKV